MWGQEFCIVFGDMKLTSEKGLWIPALLSTSSGAVASELPPGLPQDPHVKWALAGCEDQRQNKNFRSNSEEGKWINRFLLLFFFFKDHSYDFQQGSFRVVGKGVGVGKPDRRRLQRK
jgi:hypothetical protein